jgi:hypothetical protein
MSDEGKKAAELGSRANNRQSRLDLSEHVLIIPEDSFSSPAGFR